MNASPAVKMIEPHANLFGTKIMEAYLESEIAAGKGSLYLQDMYDLAEVVFTHNKATAHVWYQHAYEQGKTDALTRYEERMIYYK
jgi:hypothetical protein